MSAPFPPALKPIFPFIKHAKQLEGSDPVMSYYCKLYALQQGIPLIKGLRDDQAKKYLLDLMDALEEEKEALNDILTQEDMNKKYVERFALKVFKFADDEDRSGRAHKGTAQSYYAASIFIEVCSQFGELSEDLQSMKKYAKWKATDITKALKEGRTPVPGPPGGLSAEELELQEELRRMEGGSNNNNNNLFPPSPAAPKQAPPPAAPQSNDDFGFPSIPKSTPSQSQQFKPSGTDEFGFPSVPKSTPSQFQPSGTDEFGFPSIPKSTPNQQFKPSSTDEFGFPSVPKSTPNQSQPSGTDEFGFPSIPKSTPNQQFKPSGTDEFGFPSVPKSTPNQSQPTGNDQFNFPTVPKTNTYVPKPAPAPAPAPAPVVAAPAPAAPVSQVPKGFTANIEGAQKNCKFAASALNFDDTNTAVKHLLKALQDLTGREYVPK